MDEILRAIRGETKIIIVDFHAEVTSEKVAMGWFLDGRVSAVIGTHTHVQTADERILPKGTAYITDAGMVGPRDSVIGVRKELVLERFLKMMPQKFIVASDDNWINGVVIEVDEETGKSSSIQRLNLKVDINDKVI
jgi:metallophosphoesterase (TIGR00282 family)